MTAALVAVVALTLVAGTAVAQPGDRREKLREQIREKVKVLRTTLLIQELNLDQATAIKLVPTLDKGYDEIGKLNQDSGQARRELRGLMDSGKATDADINRLVDRMLANRTKITAVEDGLIKEARKILKPGQVAKLIIVLPHVNRAIERQIRQAAGRGGGGPGMRRGGPPDGPGGEPDDDDLPF
jgi:hypothetical protein